MSEWINGFWSFAVPNRIIRFMGENNEEVGRFDFNVSPVTFTGDADESAKIFANAVIRMWGDRK